MMFKILAIVFLSIVYFGKQAPQHRPFIIIGAAAVIYLLKLTAHNCTFNCYISLVEKECLINNNNYMCHESSYSRRYIVKRRKSYYNLINRIFGDVKLKIKYQYICKAP